MVEPHSHSNPGEQERQSEYLFKIGVRWLVCFAAAAFSAAFLFGTILTIYYADWVVQIAREHFAAMVGLPLAALCLVILLEITTGTVKLKGFGLEFEGAGGPIVMWTFSFSAIAVAIKMLW